MQHFRNFKLVQPTTAMLAKFITEGEELQEIPLFLMSDDGTDWYDAYPLFDDHTIKIMYDANGVIRSVVDAPVPQRGNIYAASMFFPEGMSVAEISGELPEGFEIDSATWVFDGESIYQVPELAKYSPETINQNKRQYLAGIAAANIAILQAGTALNRSRDGDADALIEWQIYLCDLRDMTADDLKLSPVLFPVSPASVF